MFHLPVISGYFQVAPPRYILEKFKQKGIRMKSKLFYFIFRVSKNFTGIINNNLENLLKTYNLLFVDIERKEWLTKQNLKDFFKFLSFSDISKKRPFSISFFIDIAI